MTDLKADLKNIKATIKAHKALVRALENEAREVQAAIDAPRIARENARAEIKRAAYLKEEAVFDAEYAAWGYKVIPGVADWDREWLYKVLTGREEQGTVSGGDKASALMICADLNQVPGIEAQVRYSPAFNSIGQHHNYDYPATWYVDYFKK